MNEKHIEAAASQMGVDYGEALARMTVADVLRIVDANESRQDIEKALRANLAKAQPLPAWQDVLGDAEQLVRQKHIFAKYIKGTILENDVPVWIADFALRLLQRDRAARGVAASSGQTQRPADAVVRHQPSPAAMRDAPDRPCRAQQRGPSEWVCDCVCPGANCLPTGWRSHDYDAGIGHE